MKFQYYEDTDSLYIDLSEKKSTDSKEIAEGIVMDMDAEGNIVGIDIEHASQMVNLSKLETKGMPFEDFRMMQA